jgi:hypothetical protein
MVCVGGGDVVDIRTKATQTVTIDIAVPEAMLKLPKVASGYHASTPF